MITNRLGRDLSRGNKETWSFPREDCIFKVMTAFGQLTFKNVRPQCTDEELLCYAEQVTKQRWQKKHDDQLTN